MVAVTAVDWAWFGGFAAVAVLAVTVVWATRRRRQWPDRLPFMGAGDPRRPAELVRVLAPGESPHARDHQPPPRIDPDRRYVFGEFEPAPSDASRSRLARHDTSWALRQSTRRRRMARGSVAVLLAVAIALTILALIGNSVRHTPHTPPAHHGLVVRDSSLRSGAS